MTENIITSLITAVGLLLTQAAVSYKQHKITDVKQDYVIEELKRNMARMEAKQDKHNNGIERLAVVEQKVRDLCREVDGIKTHKNS